MNESNKAVIKACDGFYRANQRPIDLIDKARAVRMTPEEEEAQAASFAYGNVAMSCGGMTRESLDRIDSSKGYIPGNIQWVHKDVNSLKSNFDEEESIKWCTMIAEYRGHAGTLTFSASPFSSVDEA